MNTETVGYKQETVAPAKTFAKRDASQTRLIAGVSVPDGPLITAVIENAQRLSEPYLFNHAMRSWLFAEAIGRIKRIHRFAGRQRSPQFYDDAAGALRRRRSLRLSMHRRYREFEHHLPIGTGRVSD